MLHAQELGWLEHSAGVLALSDRAIISVSGEDAYEWLQGQLTNQCDGAKPGDSVYAFVLTLKGRVLADVWALFHDEGVWLDVPESQVDALLERLDRYIIMEDVDLEHRADLRLITVQGPRAAEVTQAGWAADRLGAGGRQWAVRESDLGSELERATERATELGGGPVSNEAWVHAHIIAGRPRFGVDFGDWTYPQESGLTALAVSFNKGCYIGQETVVMLENRGKAPKVLWRWAVEGDDAPAPRTPITKAGEAVGEVTSAVAADRGIRALGFIKRGHEEQDEGFEIAGKTAHPLGTVSESLAHAR